MAKKPEKRNRADSGFRNGDSERQRGNMRGAKTGNGKSTKNTASSAQRNSGYAGNDGTRDRSGHPGNGRNASAKKRGTRSGDRRENAMRGRIGRDFERTGMEEERDAFLPSEAGILVGRNPVIEALRAGRGMTRIMIAEGASGSIEVVRALAGERKIPVQYEDSSVLDRLAQGTVHQGVVAYVSDFEYCEPEDILRYAEEKGEDPFIILLDGIEDPHNLGAILRTADAAGAHGVIIPARRAAAVTPTVEKTSAGASAYVRVARVTNLTRAIRDLKQQGIWIGSADMDGEKLTETDLTGPVGLVIGNEGRGVSRLVRENCDFVVSIPMRGSVSSLNASNAAAVLMYEVLRQRDLR